ncbi:hypothetical protein GQ607_003366 [Colletotrichum asianum]|uniref:Uncharacterized protein n=1 Tax=Colletotrichum asianum TaxID=702518 RepID=A0A8H3WRP6_9PEZI|nr:hypothetical protein GQ607_003366 [Colletotrichum asianum]
MQGKYRNSVFEETPRSQSVLDCQNGSRTGGWILDRRGNPFQNARLYGIWTVAEDDFLGLPKLAAGAQSFSVNLLCSGKLDGVYRTMIDEIFPDRCGLGHGSR